MRNRVALITGASRGIGREVALELSGRGAAVAVNYRTSRELAEQLIGEIDSNGGTAVAVHADLSESGDISRMVAGVQDQLGPIDILVNNAGVLHRGDLEHYEPQKLEAMRHINVDALVQVTHAVVPSMRERGFGRIVNISSIAAFGTSVRGNTFYAATKAAVNTLTRRFAMELGAHGITVNAVAPGYIDTDMAREGRSAQESAELAQRISSVSMVGRVGTPRDIANAVAFLASDESGFITAQILTVDGGRMDYIAHP